MDSKDKRVFDKSIKLADNAMLKRRPELFYEWDFEKNDELGLDVYKVTYGSTKTAWWKCLACKSEYDVSPERRCRMTKPCPYCAGKRVNHTNSLATTHPDLASEWSFELNTISPHEITYGSPRKVWWECKTCKSNFDALVSNRARLDTGCKYCTSQVANETNSLKTRFSEVASQWHPAKNGGLTSNDVLPFSSKRVW